MRNYLTKNRAQATIEFSLAFIMAILFLLLTCNLFVWLNHCVVGRQAAYEKTRVEAGDGRDEKFLWFVTEGAEPGKGDFYKTPDLNIFMPGGIGKK
jgi:hypothetical protein